jgi:hypothetical protein
MKTINLTKGYVAMVDDDDYARINQYEWCVGVTTHGDGSKTLYAKRCANKTETFYLMHRLILSITDPTIEVDHVDHNGLNNQKHNLRVATSSQNQGNAQVRSDNTSGFKGVTWHKHQKRWLPQLQTKERKIYLGSFVDKVKAALAYDKAAREYFGEFAHTNESLGLLPKGEV